MRCTTGRDVPDIQAAEAIDSFELDFTEEAYLSEEMNDEEWRALLVLRASRAQYCASQASSSLLLQSLHGWED